MADKKVCRIGFDELKFFCKEAYVQVGVPDDEAEIVSDLLVRSDLRGIATHGVMRLPIYIERLEKNYVRKKCEFNLIKQKGATAYAEANGSMGHIVSHKAMNLAINLAQDHGVSWVSVKNSGHFGVTGLFPMMAAAKDMIGYICSNSAPMMAPYGGRERMIGNNPLSYAFPTEKRLPVVLDFSCSVVASGRLVLMHKKGEKIPLGWAVDKNGLPTEDPYEGYAGGGSLLPIANHKGSGLALAHEMLSALLVGGKLTRNIKSLYEEDKSGIQGTCHSFMVIDPECFCGRKEFKKSMDDYITAVKNSAKAKGVEEIFMPGEVEANTEAAYKKDGIIISEVTVNGLMDLANRLGIVSPEFK